MSTESHAADDTPLDADLPPSADADRVPDDEADWACDELELAYRQALQAVEAVEHQVELQGDFDLSGDEFPAGGTASDGPAAAGPPEAAARPSADEPQPPGVTPRQIIEAALFVGGVPLTIKRIGSLLRDEFDHDFLEQTIDELNSQYADEQRPYEIAFGEGGYRLALLPEFERLRDRSYGLGPKEVKLSQDALEALALVAYRQPVSARQIEEAGKKNPAAVLRQLVRRELIAIERGEERRSDVKYRTTPRFLELFGLKDLDELPQSDGDLSYK